MLFLVNMTNLLWSFEHSSLKNDDFKNFDTLGGPRGPNGAQNQKKLIDKIPGDLKTTSYQNFKVLAETMKKFKILTIFRPPRAFLASPK